MPGPIPKRSEERRRRNADGAEVLVVDLDSEIAGEVEIPAPPMRYHDEDTGELLEEPEPIWHPTAMTWYMSLAKSGQSIFYEDSDWATAYVLAEQLHLALQPRPSVIGEDSEGEPIIRWMVVPMPGAALTAFLKGSASLMTSEGERRRLRIELDRKARADAALGEDSNVIDIVKHREDLFKGASRG